MEEHTKFLAERLLSEERPITYRLLSRALDVHVNTAKEMLYDFHKYQNSIKPASIHATYLVYGSKSAVKAEADGDVDMTSSAPEQDDLTDTVPCATMTLVAEDKLQDTLSQYQDVTSLHVYSLSPQPQKDLTSLSDVAQSISEYPALDDAAAQAKKYGGIVNPHLRKRTRKNAPPPPAPTPAATASKPVKTEPAKAAPATTKVKTESVPSQPKESTPAQSFKAAPAPKKAAGGIMQSFAKAAAKPPKPKPVKKEEDTSMALSDDGEADDDDMPAPANKKSDAEIEAARTARKTREDELRRMMEEDEEEEEDEKEDEEMDEPEPEPEAEPAAPAKEEKEPQEVVSSTGDGRRRGKRRVMKKKRILDDQGYMVTIQEEGWESFSEDEAPAKKTTAPSSTPASSAPKSKKAAPSSKGSQGSIMSFFGKK